MCGIVAYIGEREAQPILVNSLKRLEYRGYDSCGIALNEDGGKVYKDKGRIEDLGKVLPKSSARAGIGHTRWATHGTPSRINAHPHLDCTHKIAVVHNGLIENFRELRRQLIEEGHNFVSETDTEVIPHLIEKYYRGDLQEAVKSAIRDLKGSYAICVCHADRQGELVVARNESPLIIGLGDKGNFAASDVPAILDYTGRVLYLEDEDIVRLTKDSVTISNNGKTVTREEHRISWTVEDAQKGGYEHFMLKEIHEQPRVIIDTLRGYISRIEPVINLGIKGGQDIRDILIVACGTSYHAALVAKFAIERLAKIPVRVELASEFNYADSVLGQTWVIGITQSGETADTLISLRKAKRAGCQTLVITNVVGSSATRIADEVFYIRAGPEISVAATKSFVAQLIALYLIALSRAKLDARRLLGLSEELRQLSRQVQRILDNQDDIVRCSRYLAQWDNCFFIARGINFATALEGALKLKEISYIHAEGYAAGELKHGPFALLTPQTPVVAIASRDSTYETVLNNIKEIKAREAPVIALAEENDSQIQEFADIIIRVPSVNNLFSPVVNAVTLQLLAYYTARERKCPIDMPRNLAKSVTVQ